MALTKAEFWAWSMVATELGLAHDGQISRSTLRKLQPGESATDSNGKPWWKYQIDRENKKYIPLTMRDNKFIYVDRDMSEIAQPKPTDAVLGGGNLQPRPYDAVLGGGKTLQLPA